MKSSLAVVLIAGLGFACGPQAGQEAKTGVAHEPASHPASSHSAGSTESVASRLEGIVSIPERWVSDWDTTANLDSPAFWTGDEGSWVITTAKGTHDLWVHDAGTGDLLRRYGRQGAGPGEFNYPNGIAVVDDLLLVIERDNHRVQMLSLPGFEPLGWFGEDDLLRPYGVALHPAGDGWDVFVTDDYGNEIDLPDGVPPTGDFSKRVKKFRIDMSGDGSPAGRLIKAFGDHEGEGALLVVESIQVDEDNDALLVADEFSLELELYGLDGRYQGRTIGAGLYKHGDPEGIMLFRCGEAGYWVLTDQGDARTVFHLLDRRSFEFVGSFAGEVTANTDGIWLTQDRVPGLGWGALFALHDDGGLSAFAWEDIARVVGLDSTCSAELSGSAH